MNSCKPSVAESHILFESQAFSLPFDLTILCLLYALETGVQSTLSPIYHLRLNGVEKPTLVPSPVLHRWGSWFKTLNYHSKFIRLIASFIESESKTNESVACEKLHETLSSKQKVDEIELKMKAIVINSEQLYKMLDLCEVNNQPLIHSLFNKIEDLKLYLHNRTLTGIPEFNALFQCAHDKLTSMIEKQSNWEFIKACRIFDPVQLPILSTDMSLYYAIPYLRSDDACPEGHNRLLDEWSVYVKGSYPHAVEPEFDLIPFWQSMKTRVPMLSAIALNCLSIPLSSVDVERSFSTYRDILSDKRENLTVKNLRSFLALYANKLD